MGSISTNKKTGQKRYVYYDQNNTFRSLWLGDVSTAVAESFRTYADRIVNAQLMNVSIDAETSRWLADLADKFYDRLAAQGLVPSRKTVPTLGECIPKIIASRAPTVSGQTLEIWGQSEKSLYTFFGQGKGEDKGKERRVDNITRLEAESFRSWLVSKGRFDGKGGLKPTTVWKRLQHVVAFFETMVKEGIITKNPFDGLTMSPVVDTDRNVYVDEETISQVMDVLPCAEWRLLVALWRFGGLRGSSEPLLLKWTDILWDQKKIVVHAKKTKRYEGKATRIIPIFPELVQPLEEAFELAEEGAVYVIERIAPAYLQNSTVDRSKLDKISANFGTIFGGYLERAGLVRWSKIINNLRASMETDLLDGKYGSLGINAIADWLGHSPKVMLTHYKRVSEEKFKQVTQYKPAQKRSQSIGSNFDSTKSPKMSVSPEITRENVKSALAVYLTVHSPEQGINRRQGTETGQAPMLSQLLILGVNKVL